MKWLLIVAALVGASARADEGAGPSEDLVVSCAIANTLVAARSETGSHKLALQARATAYTQLARQAFGLTDEAIAVGLRALNSKINTGVTRWSDVVTFAEQCPVLPMVAADGV
jgi:hypothetical protein